MILSAHEQRLEIEARGQNGRGAHRRNLRVLPTRGHAVPPCLARRVRGPSMDHGRCPAKQSGHARRFRRPSSRRVRLRSERRSRAPLRLAAAPGPGIGNVLAHDGATREPPGIATACVPTKPLGASVLRATGMKLVELRDGSSNEEGEPDAVYEWMGSGLAP